ncbi:hypothetical protein ACFWNL_35920 [Kitasatospora sp. NPDC058397]|uniref:hypothetical protein n=1 Tax=unclassified Kitasatospora TaxID=2633591 RepID=UPI003659D041
MARVGHTYTRHFDLDPKQHELLGFDLGEGAPRRALILGLVLYLLWDIPLIMLFGLPGLNFGFSIYVLPPGLIAIFGAQRSTRIERRRYVTTWALSIRYLVLGHRPIICGGRRAASRGEWLGRRARWGSRLDLLLESPLGGLLERWLGPEGNIPAGAGAPLRLHAQPRLYGPDAVAKAYGRRALSTTRTTQGEA